MKTLSLFLLLVTVSLFFGCKKTETASVPVLTTVPVTMFTERTATSGGIINSAGGGVITQVGICWSTTANPTTADSVSLSVTSTSSFTCNMTYLNFATVYHVRAFAINSAGTGYGDDVSFTTAGTAPTAATDSVNSITAVGATLFGAVNPNYLSSTVIFVYGTSTNYSDTVAYSKNPLQNNIPLSVSADITGLTPGTTYHFRVEAVNPIGTGNGNDLTFTTLVAMATTQASTNISSTEATLNGIVNAYDLPATVTFEYGTTTSYGSIITASQSPVTGDTDTNVSANISGLTKGTTYHFRVKVVNSLGTVNGDDLTFKTLTE
jgi:Fibronectin type III domain